MHTSDESALISTCDIRKITNNQQTMRWKKKKFQKLKQLSLEHFIVYT